MTHPSAAQVPCSINSDGVDPSDPILQRQSGTSAGLTVPAVQSVQLEVGAMLQDLASAADRALPESQAGQAEPSEPLQARLVEAWEGKVRHFVAHRFIE